MAGMDVFNSDAFRMQSLMTAIDRVPYQPQYLGNLRIFEPKPLRTDLFSVEERDGTLNLIQTSERGEAPAQRATEARTARNFRTLRLAKSDTIKASEIAGIRAFGSENELMQVQDEVARRYVGPTGIMRDLELTWELHRLGAVQGIVLDANGDTIVNLYTAFGVAQPTEIDFDLDAASPASGAVRRKCSEVSRAMQRAAKGAWVPSTYIEAICGDAFWDDLTAHSEVRQTYLNTQEAQALRGPLAFEQFSYGGIHWTNYRGTDDNTTVAVGTDKAKFFPVNAPGAFQTAWGPGESMDVVNQLGRPFFPMLIMDKERQFWVKPEVYSYPYFICTRPLMLQSARRT